MALICHIRDCTAEGKELLWLPHYGVSVALCPTHDAMCEPGKGDLVIDMQRARVDHDKALEEFEGCLDKIIERSKI